MKTHLITAAATLALAASFCLTPSSLVAKEAAPVVWKAGVSSAKITPESPMWMAGYAARKAPSEGVDLDLFAKALAFEDKDGGVFVLVTMDLIGVPRNVRLYVAEQAQKQFGLAPERLALNASHTHSGPELRADKAYRTDNPDQRAAESIAYTKKLQDTLVRLIGEALETRAPASISFSRARCGVAMNRRAPDGKGGWKNFPNPNGPVDTEVPVLKISREDGKEIAILFSYACHCTTLGGQKFNGDLAGYAQKYLQEAHPGATALFVNGCSGDQNPYPRRTIELAENHGRSLATAVEAALTTEMQPLSGSIRTTLREIPLAFDTPLSRKELEEMARNGPSVLDKGHAERVLAVLDKEGALPTDYPYPVQVVRLGDQLTWIGLGGETVVDYSLRLKSELKDPIVWVSGYSNDVPTYVPSHRVWKEGGYEGGDAMKWGSFPARWGENTEEHIISTVHELRASLK